MKRFTDSTRPYQEPHSCAFWLTTKLRLPKLIGFLAPVGDAFNTQAEQPTTCTVENVWSGPCSGSDAFVAMVESAKLRDYSQLV